MVYYKITLINSAHLSTLSWVKVEENKKTMGDHLPDIFDPEEERRNGENVEVEET